MNPCILQLTVLFEDIFWIGIFEHEEGNNYSISKITFGAEPKNEEIYLFILNHYHQLAFFTSCTKTKPGKKQVNPKRLQRIVQKQMEQKGVGTKAQEALKQAYSMKKLEKKKKNAVKQQQRKEHKFLLHQEKKKQKHRGH